MLGWYDEIVAAVDRVSAGGEIGRAARSAVADARAPRRRHDRARRGVLADATATLSRDEVASNAAVMMFGGIETERRHDHRSSGTSSRTRTSWRPCGGSLAGRQRRRGVAPPGAGGRPCRPLRHGRRELAGAAIRQGDLVIVSLTAANRDPATFPDPTRSTSRGPNARSHLAFAQGPHACVGIHLARLETLSALDAVLDGWPALRIDEARPPPSGVIFRKPRSLPVSWAI